MIWLKRQWPSQHSLLWKNTSLWLFSLPGRNGSLKNVSVRSLNYFSQVQSLNCDFKNWPLTGHLSAWRHERTWSSSFSLNVQNKARADVVKTELRVPPGGRKHATLSFMEISTTGNLQTHSFVPLALLRLSKSFSWRMLFHILCIYLYSIWASVAQTSDWAALRGFVDYLSVATLATFSLNRATFCVH